MKLKNVILLLFGIGAVAASSFYCFRTYNQCTNENTSNLLLANVEALTVVETSSNSCYHKYKEASSNDKLSVRVKVCINGVCVSKKNHIFE